MRSSLATVQWALTHPHCKHNAWGTAVHERRPTRQPMQQLCRCRRHCRQHLAAHDTAFACTCRRAAQPLGGLVVHRHGLLHTLHMSLRRQIGRPAHQQQLQDRHAADHTAAAAAGRVSGRLCSSSAMTGGSWHCSYPVMMRLSCRQLCKKDTIAFAQQCSVAPCSTAVLQC